MKSKKPVQPVSPDAMEMLFFYACPFCKRHVPLIAPTQPTMVSCENCHQAFPIIPVDERSLHFVRIMLANGKAAVDPDFA